jgi:hypothetical protein
MNLLLLLPLVFPFLCLAAVSLLGFLGVLAIGATLQVIAWVRLTDKVLTRIYEER